MAIPMISDLRVQVKRFAPGTSQPVDRIYKANKREKKKKLKIEIGIMYIIRVGFSVRERTFDNHYRTITISMCMHTA